MKKLFSIIFSIFLNAIVFPDFVLAQTGSHTHQLKERLNRIEQQKAYPHDTAYVNALIDLAYLYSTTYPDSTLLLLKGNAERCHALGYGEGETDTWLVMGDAFQTKGMYENAMEYFNRSSLNAKKINYLKAIPLIQNRIGTIHLNQGNFPEALSSFYESLKAAESIKNRELIVATLNNIAVVHFYQGKFNEAEVDYQQILKTAMESSDSNSMSLAYNGIGEVNLYQKNPEKALHNLSLAYNLALKTNDAEMLLTAELSMGEAYYELDSLQKAASLFENSLTLSRQRDQGTSICNALIGLAKVRNKQGMFKEALAYGLEGLQKAESMGQVQLIRDASQIVSLVYESMGEGMNAIKYYRIYKVNSDSLNNLESQRVAAAEKAGYEFSKKEIVFQRQTLQQRWIIFSAFAALLLSGVILWLINRNRKRLDHTNKELQKKNEVIENQKLMAEETLFKLQSTQAQLIQAEKMASLGELTAGIAHEIQNPLNFVNNFSEVNKDLLEEMKEEIQKGNLEMINTIADDVINNEEKINHHGKRADSIVKGMLQHSRNGSGEKTPTHLNALADEYLRLAYQGLRAKDKSFNTNLKTDFDQSVGTLNIIPQDIGRVLLNLYNNAFYAVNQKQKEKEEPGDKQKTEIYQPEVSVSTNRKGNQVKITVKDNGNGIPNNIVDKIFQPFFTTKPTGQGTGLGLSLSYDIIKAHGGKIEVYSTKGTGSEFIITLNAN